MNSKDTARTCVPPRRWPCVGRDETNSLSASCVYLLGLRRAPMRTYGPGLVYARRTYQQWYGHDVRTYIPYNMVLTRRTTQSTTQQAPKRLVFTPPRREGLRFTRPKYIHLLAGAPFTLNRIAFTCSMFHAYCPLHYSSHRLCHRRATVSNSGLSRCLTVK